MLIASISHHGRPIKDNPDDWNKNIWKQVAGAYDPASVLYDIGKRVVEIYAQAFESGGKPLPSAPAFGHLLARLVQLTD